MYKIHLKSLDVYDVNPKSFKCILCNTEQLYSGNHLNYYLIK